MAISICKECVFLSVLYYFIMQIIILCNAYSAFIIAKCVKIKQIVRNVLKNIIFLTKKNVYKYVHQVFKIMKAQCSVINSFVEYKIVSNVLLIQSISAWSVQLIGINSHYKQIQKPSNVFKHVHKDIFQITIKIAKNAPQIVPNVTAFKAV